MKDIDREIAEKVMGWEVEEYHGFNVYRKNNTESVHNWHPSYNIKQAFEVVTHTLGDPLYQWNKFGVFKPQNYGKYLWRVSIYDGRTMRSVTEELLPLAICKAALEAIK